jgi:hypothetical protein
MEGTNELSCQRHYVHTRNLAWSVPFLRIEVNLKFVSNCADSISQHLYSISILDAN